MKIIIPMAGLGSRFQIAAHTNPEYKKPKPFINVKGHPMVRWATRSLPFLRHHEEDEGDMHVNLSDVTFVILKEHDVMHDIARKLREKYSPEIHVVILDGLTRGAAETVYMAAEHIDEDDDLLVSDSDHFFDGTFLAQRIREKHPDTAGIIPVFRARNDGIPKWSYALVDDGIVITQVGEKDRDLMDRGAYANIGAYYFSKGRIFIDEVEEALQHNRMHGSEGKKEFYIAPLYQGLIEKGMRIEAAITPEVWGLGTPDDLEYFLANYRGSIN